MTTYPLTRQRNLVLAALLVLSAVAWAVLIARSGEMDDGMGLTMGMNAFVFIGIWIAMMVAMMFPTAAPMILTFESVQAGRRERQQSFVPTWLFVLSYLAIWSFAGVIFYVVARVADSAADHSMWVMDNAARIGGAILLLAGIYQLTPLKNACLSKCRTPMSFILTSWRDGAVGTLRMGLEHGSYCLGCCWLLFVILFPLGMMNVAAMAGITLVIFAEKSLAIGPWVARAAAVGLIAYGLVVLVTPSALPTTM